MIFPLFALLGNFTAAMIVALIIPDVIRGPRPGTIR